MYTYHSLPTVRGGLGMDMGFDKVSELEIRAEAQVGLLVGGVLAHFE